MQDASEPQHKTRSYARQTYYGTIDEIDNEDDYEEDTTRAFAQQDYGY